MSGSTSQLIGAGRTLLTRRSPRQQRIVAPTAFQILQAVKASCQKKIVLISSTDTPLLILRASGLFALLNGLPF
jgi:hypothetical protein